MEIVIYITLKRDSAQIFSSVVEIFGQEPLFDVSEMLKSQYNPPQQHEHYLCQTLKCYTQI